MDDRSKPMSRRGLFEALARPFSRQLERVKSPQFHKDPVLDEDVPKQAIIQGRFCLAYQGGVCFTCSERCPEPGAITTNQGIPTVHADICTDCTIRHDLCPAPRNAILMMAQPSAKIPSAKIPNQ